MGRYDISGPVKIEFLLCKNRRNCENCLLNGARCLRKRREVVLLEDVIYTLPDGRQLLIRKGFIFDGGSIDRFFWRIIGHPLDHEFIRAVLLHDIFYASEIVSRAEADEHLRGFMKDYDSISLVKRNTMYYAVRAGGGFVWDKHTPESIAKAREYVTFI